MLIISDGKTIRKKKILIDCKRYFIIFKVYSFTELKFRFFKCFSENCKNLKDFNVILIYIIIDFPPPLLKYDFFFSFGLIILKLFFYGNSISIFIAVCIMSLGIIFWNSHLLILVFCDPHPLRQLHS